MIGRLTAAWNAFFHRPAPVIGLALFRILWGLTLLLNWALLAPDALTWLGEDGALSRATALRLTGGRLDVLAILPATDAAAIAVFALTGLASASLTLGFMTRTSAALTFVGLTSIHHRNFLILNSGDCLLRVVTFLLIFAGAGKALSIDSWRRGRTDAAAVVHPMWAQRLIQIQIAVVYLSTVLYKLDGPLWRDGTAVYYLTRLTEFQRFEIPYMFEHLWTLKALTWASLVVELALAVLIWIRPLRYPVLAAGVLLHLGLEYTLNVPVFQWAMLAGLTSFVEPEEAAAAWRRLTDTCRRWRPAQRHAAVD